MSRGRSFLSTDVFLALLNLLCYDDCATLFILINLYKYNNSNNAYRLIVYRCACMYLYSRFSVESKKH